MQQRGRPSQADLTTVTPLRVHREIDAPSELGADAQALWQRIVASKPSDWFDVSAVPLLAQYCNLAIQARVVAAQLDEAMREATLSEYRFKRYERMCAMQKTITGQLKSLATALRLSPQSRYDAKEAATAARSGAAGCKPWQMAFNNQP